MGFFKRLFGKSEKNINVEKILLAICDAGGKGIVQVPFDYFVDFAKSHAEILPSAAGELICMVPLYGERTKVQFISGALSFDINDNETMVNVFQITDFERNVSPEKIEELAKSAIDLINKEIDSQELARFTAYMMYCNFDNSSMDRADAPEAVEVFMHKCTEGLTLFDEQYDDVLEKNIRKKFYLNNREFDEALDTFMQIINNVQDQKIKNHVGYSILQKFISTWKL
ncbi:hypothetical protein [Pseudoalteromonas maricaloris]|uniref:hypothetical protein n=1 Tax=Pseudoalteromonas maricaloris TaxID=184924 RepID=UPI00029AB442|nr:hypothetical protein [Pseudoalteromonas flavipulchra]